MSLILSPISISSNIFGLTDKIKQNEKTVLNPNSIYGLAKATAYHACKMYSRTYNLFVCGAIFYNHESPKRSNEYVSKKIVENIDIGGPTMVRSAAKNFKDVLIITSKGNVRHLLVIKDLVNVS